MSMIGAYSDEVKELLPGVWTPLKWVFLLGLLTFLPAHFLPLAGKQVNNIFYVTVALPVLLSVVLSFRYWAVLVWNGRFLFGFLFVVSIAILASGRPTDLKPWLYTTLFCLAVAHCSHHQRLFRLVLNAFAAILISLAGLALLQWGMDSIESGRAARMQLWGAGDNPNFSALAIAGALLYLWLFHVERRLSGRAWQIVGLCLLCAAVILVGVAGQSRSTLLGFVLFMLFYAFLRGKAIVVAGVVAGVVLAVFLLGWHEIIAQRGLSYRPVIWADLLSRFYEGCNLVLGCGREKLVLAGKFEGPHSAYFGTLYSYGFLGAAAFMLFALSYFRSSICRKSDWFLVSLLGWGASVTMMDGFIGSPAPLWIYFWLPTVAALYQPGVSEPTSPEHDTRESAS